MRKFIYKGYEIVDHGLHYAIPELKNHFLHSIHDVDLFIHMKGIKK